MPPAATCRSAPATSTSRGKTIWCSRRSSTTHSARSRATSCAPATPGRRCRNTAWACRPRSPPARRSAVAGKTTTDSLIVVRANGARPGDRFEVLVNEQLAGTIVGNRPLTLALPTYRAYQVRIRPTGKDLLAYDSSPRSVGLNPGR